jgi:DNA-binding winged helix-turn-helix (wHTH) protein
MEIIDRNIHEAGRNLPRKPRGDVQAELDSLLQETLDEKWGPTPVPQATHPSRVVHFGVFEVDLRTGELRKGGLKIRLQDQPFQVLATLLEQPGEIVTREELRRRLWPNDTFVDFNHSINKAVNRLREALSDSANNPRFVETLPRRGYRFVAPVNWEKGAPARPAPPPEVIPPPKPTVAPSHRDVTRRNQGLEFHRRGLILAVLSQLRKEQYGYSLKKALADRGLEIDEGMLYPLLRRLEAGGLLRSRWRVEEGRLRRYYRTNSHGERVQCELAADWQSLARSMEQIIR